MPSKRPAPQPDTLGFRSRTAIVPQKPDRCPDHIVRARKEEAERDAQRFSAAPEFPEGYTPPVDDDASRG